MNPRFPPTLIAAGRLAHDQKDWADANRYSRALIDIDPTDERAWALLATVARKRGDSVQLRSVIEEAFRYIPAPSNVLLVYMVYAGDAMGFRFVRMTPEQIRIETLPDSVTTYYDNKADFFLGRGDLPRARIYHDSIIKKLEGRNLAGPSEPYMRLFLANAYAFSGRASDAMKELGRARTAAKAQSYVRPDGTLRLNSRSVAAVLASNGQYDAAVKEARRLLTDESWTRAGLAREPKLRPLRGNPAYNAFLKERE